MKGLLAQSHSLGPNPPPIKKLSPSELQDRWSKGLRFNCNEIFGPGHRCKKIFLIEGCWSDKEEEGLPWEDEVAAEHELQKPWGQGRFQRVELLCA